MRRCDPSVPRSYEQLGQRGVALLPGGLASGGRAPCGREAGPPLGGFASVGCREGARLPFQFQTMPRISSKFIYRTRFQNLFVSRSVFDFPMSNLALSHSFW